MVIKWGGYRQLRLPGLIVSDNDTLLVALEARYTESDDGFKDCLVYRSSDYGESWNRVLVIGNGYEVIGNPVLLNYHGGVALCVSSGYLTGEGGKILIYHSLDDGLNWSSAQDITSDIQADFTYMFVPGPSHGTMFSSGKVFIPCWQLETNTSGYGISYIISDDNIKSWKRINIDLDSSISDPTEWCMVECGQGVLYGNIRSTSGFRGEVFIKNNTVISSSLNKKLTDPNCFGSCVKFYHRPNVILFSNCDNSESRKNLVLKGSCSDLESIDFVLEQTIEVGIAGYSDIAVDSRGAIYIVYEVNYGLEPMMLAITSYKNFKKIER
ncbi:MAG: exo-alpha-sialidase [Treponema sp.]|nr:exo-alpha-sialidase [Treponema sp.]